MGNDTIGQIFDKFEKFRPEKTIMKIWNKGDLYVILGVKDPEKWQMEMDPYYIYAKGKIDGISFLDNADVLNRVVKPENLVYHDERI